MNTLRWIFGFPLAAAISIGFFYLSIEYGITGIYMAKAYFISYVFRFAAIIFCFAIWVFLTCFFIPSFKKLAGMVPMAATTVLIIVVIYLNARDEHSIKFNQSSIFAFSSFYIGMLAGYFVSYILFKDKGWGRAKKPYRHLPSGLDRNYG